jgi:hypothetical protein
MGQVYHESNLWGFCFGMFGIYYFMSYYFNGKTNALLFLSLVSGLALITRVTFFISTGFLFLICIIKYLKENVLNKEISKPKCLARTFLILIPLLLAMLLQGDYNYKRFGSYTKFADYNHYNLIVNEEFRRDIYYKYGFLSFARLGYTIKSYFAFNKNCFDSKYPYVRQSINRTENTKNVLIYDTLPFSISAPWLLLIVILGLFFLIKSKKLLLYKIGTVGFLIQFLSFLLLFEVHQRYFLDLMIGMIYLSFIFFINIRKSFNKVFWRLVFICILVLGIFSMFTNVLSTLDGVRFFWKS